MNKVFDLYYSTDPVPKDIKVDSVLEVSLGYFYPDIITSEVTWAIRSDNVLYMINNDEVKKYMNMRGK